MKPLVVILVALLCNSTSNAALTVTVSPSTSGTAFVVTQTSVNPQINLDDVTVGFLFGIVLSSHSVRQDSPLLGHVSTFSNFLGTLSNIAGSGTSRLTSLSFAQNGSGATMPVLQLQGVVEFASNQTHQLVLTSSGLQHNSLSFANYVPGTYTEQDLFFGSITTIIIPEPSSALSIICGALLVGLPRRRAQLLLPAFLGRQVELH